MNKGERIEHELDRLDERGSNDEPISSEQAFRVVVEMQRRRLGAVDSFK